MVHSVDSFSFRSLDCSFSFFFRSAIWPSSSWRRLRRRSLNLNTDVVEMKTRNSKAWLQKTMLDSQAHNPDTYKIGGHYIAIFKYEYHPNNHNCLNNGSFIQSQRTIVFEYITMQLPQYMPIPISLCVKRMVLWSHFTSL